MLLVMLNNSGHRNITVNTIQNGPFRDCSEMGEGASKKTPLPETCHTYPTMMKLSTVLP